MSHIVDENDPEIDGDAKAYNIHQQHAYGLGVIREERFNQSYKHNYREVEDDKHINGELVAAAVAYATITDPDGAGENAIHCWPWSPESFKPSENPIHNLAKAGAFIAAEIDRYKRAGFDYDPS